MQSCHIVLLRQRHLLLNLLPMRAVVDGSSLYELNTGEPVVIPFTGPAANIFITNGFHRSDVLQLKHEAGASYFFRVTTIINNWGLIAAVTASLLLFVLYALYGHVFLLLLANLPVVLLLLLFFFNPRSAIVLKPWQPSGSIQ